MNISKKLTKKVVEGVSPDILKEVFVWDTELKGFGLRVYPTGRRIYFVQYRNQFHRTRRKKIGPHGQVTTEQAREMAKAILGDVAKGEDPSQEAQTKKSRPSMADLAKEYLEFHAKTNKRPKSYLEDQKMLESFILKRWSQKQLEEVTSYEIQLLHQELRDKPYMANRVRALLSKMFNIAIHWKWLETENPVQGVQKYQEHKRDRWLNEDELEKLWAVLESYPNQSVAKAIWLLLLTGSRRKEVLEAQWEQFDLVKGTWIKPAHTTKQNRMEYLPLSSHAIALLEKMQKTSTTKHLFPGKVEGKPLQDIKKAWKTIQKRAGLEKVRLHDLRHTYASHLVSSGLSLSIVGKLLGHTQASTTQRYAHLADEPLREATEFFGNKTQKIREKAAK